MRILLATGAAWLLAAIGSAGAARGQSAAYPPPSLLPIPSVYALPAADPAYPAAQPAAFGYNANPWPYAGYAPGPAPQPAPPSYRETTPRYAGMPVAYGYGANPWPYAGYAPGPAPQPAPPSYREMAPMDGGMPVAPGVGPGPYYRTTDHGNGYQQATQSPWCAETPCAEAPCGAACPPCWWVIANGLIMTRDGDNPYYFSYDGADERDQRLEGETRWGGGFEVRLGRYYDCGRWALEAAYWGLFPGAAVSQVHDYDVVGSLDGILNWDQLDYNGASANNWVNDAVCHRLTRDFDVHNVELNLLGFPLAGANDPCCAPKFALNWLMGPRYLLFSDDLEFGADTSDSSFDGDPEEIYYRIDLDNHLVGFQLGGQCRYLLAPRLRLDTVANLGVYGNHITHRSWIGGAAGDAVINNGPNVGEAFDISTSKTDVAFLGEARLGLNYQFSSHWSASLGYRAVALTGVALPTNQIYPDLRGIQDVVVVDSNGSVILHGGYAGVELNY